MSIQEQLKILDSHLEKLQETEKDRQDFQVFRRYYEQFISVPSIIDWSQMRPFDSGQLMENYEDLPELSDDQAREVLSHVAVIKLNGGFPIGFKFNSRKRLNPEKRSKRRQGRTKMVILGCSGPKSLITVRGGKTFLDFAIEQNELLKKRYNIEVPLYLMDSFRTGKATQEWLESRGLQNKVRQFTQSRCPRIYEKTLMPVMDSPEEAFYPPGHGNIFTALETCGLLDELIKQGRDVIFVSNVDNTAACVDVKIASVICRDDVDYCMEITEKTQQDIKGGTLIEYDNCIKHLELPHVPADRVDEFCSLHTFKTFNTNNVWVDLKSVKAKLPTMKLEVLPNKKKLKSGEVAIQLESAVGGAIKNFERVRVVNVHRARFLPVKKAQDLLVIMGNAFVVDPKTGVLCLNPERSIPQAPIVHLSSHYENVDDFLKHFPRIPDMLGLDTLTIRGDVYFGRDITLKGNVNIEGNGSIPDRTFIEGQYTLNN